MNAPTTMLSGGMQGLCRYCLMCKGMALWNLIPATGKHPMSLREWFKIG